MPLEAAAGSLDLVGMERCETRFNIRDRCFGKFLRLRDAAGIGLLTAADLLAADGRSSMIDQYAEDSCGQHRTEHDVDRFKCVAVPHQNRANITTTVFKSRTFTGSKFSMLLYGIRL